MNQFRMAKSDASEESQMAGETAFRFSDRSEPLDPVLLAVLANRFEAIVREMTNTMQRAAYSTILSLARDFSCSIVTANNELLASAEGLPIHIYGSELMAEAMCRLHPDRVEGDAFLHNDPYLGNSHPADHTILVPIFIDGVHMFTTVAKGHVADCGNSLPTTFMPGAKDVYEEGAIIFPCVRVQRDYVDIDDIIRMCQSRIRVPEFWYGDYLATVAAARIGEQRVKETVARYGMDIILQFIKDWLDYSERKMAAGVRKLPRGRLEGHSRHDPFPRLPDGFPLNVLIDIDPENGYVDIDLRDNIDCVPGGINESMACSICCGVQGVFTALEPDIPHNAGSFRRVRVHLRENCVVGIPRFPHSCSCATGNPAARLINLIQSTFAQVGDGWGVAEGGISHNVGYSVISGQDWRRDNAPFITQVILGCNGGPGSPVCDGWLVYTLPNTNGLLYRDSVEIDEQKLPILIRSIGIAQDSGGPGRFRGAPGLQYVFGPRENSMTATFPAEGHHTPAKGVRGGHAGGLASAFKIDRDGVRTKLPNIFVGEIQPGEWLAGVDTGGGGYGDPLQRDPELVRHDVLEKWVSLHQARETYGVIFKGQLDDDSLVVDVDATSSHRYQLGNRMDAHG